MQYGPMDGLMDEIVNHQQVNLNGNDQHKTEFGGTSIRMTYSFEVCMVDWIP